jgi:hypothetical protein
MKPVLGLPFARSEEQEKFKLRTKPNGRYDVKNIRKCPFSFTAIRGECRVEAW